MTAGRGGSEEQPAGRPGDEQGEGGPGQAHPPGYPPPEQGYPPPGQGHGQPGQGYPPPSPGYGQPGQGYPPPSPGYGQPGQGYPPPGQGYPPPGQGYGQPGQGYPPAPSGWQGYPPAPSQGYGPAPSGWGGPTPLERPATVRAGIGAFMANLILGVIASLVTFSDIDSLISRALAEAGNPGVGEGAIRAGIIVGAVIGLVFVALEALFIWFAWQGRNWARIVLFVVGGLGIVSGLASLFSGTSPSGFLSALSGIQLVLVIAGVVLLALASSNEWYRYRAWERATGRGR